VPIIGTDPGTSTSPKTASASASCSTSSKIPSPANGTATSVEGSLRRRARIGYPVLVRPSYVLGGRAMVIAYDEDTVRRYMREAVTFSQERPVLIDRFLEDATEVDVDALCDGENVLIAGIMEHIEEAGVHSGDSSCVLPARFHRSRELWHHQGVHRKARPRAERHRLMNVQYAIKDGKVYVLEVNPRASRTVPYVSKATGVPLPKIAVGLMLGKKLTDSLTSRRPTKFRRAARAPVLRQVAGVPVQQVPRRGSGARPGNALHRRSDGRRRELRRSLRQGAVERRNAAARQGHRLHQRERPHKPRPSNSRSVRRVRLQISATRGTAAALRRRTPVQDRLQGERRPPERGGPAQAGALQLVIYTTTGATPSATKRPSAAPRVAYRVPCITTFWRTAGRGCRPSGIPARPQPKSCSSDCRVISGSGFFLWAPRWCGPRASG
jgi:carbamoyl-phosphate synthase large subunit